ncbi:WhiB family transcriptional regulator [Nocardiopsis flavescens]|uniref:Transcriptional regulator WhiB n=1 Tax=Nocardiopsis flavescens TaxID=758803 RepID=A0A1M6T3F2_9ACTN|nr:WhiB family transcriptional regulator [Nocardiopsis flavescens]SHK51512.1 WhiB family transcriptional regulator, redox-sensing transcriptional regulator [Nocardiopsis flavescens]
MNRLYHDSEDWVAQGRCRAYDPEIFFPVSTTGIGRADTERALEVCGGCTVRRECLRWALRAGEADGVWGGTTPEERRYMRRELAPAV